MLFPQSLKLLFFYAVLPILTRIALAAPEDYQRLTEALHREAESIKDDYCYACLRATVLVGFSLSEGVRMNLERSRDEDWYPYLGLAYEDLSEYSQEYHVGRGIPVERWMPVCTSSLQQNLWSIMEPRLQKGSRPKHIRFLPELQYAEYERAIVQLRESIRNDYNCDTFEIDLYERNKAFLEPKPPEVRPGADDDALPSREEWDEYFKSQAREVVEEQRRLRESEDGTPPRKRRGKPKKSKSEDSTDDDNSQ